MDVRHHGSHTVPSSTHTQCTQWPSPHRRAARHCVHCRFLTLLFVLAGVITGDTLYQIDTTDVCDRTSHDERETLCLSDVPWVFVTFAFAILIRYVGEPCAPTAAHTPARASPSLVLPSSSATGCTPVPAPPSLALPSS
jgi:hypothetical protein